MRKYPPTALSLGLGIGAYSAAHGATALTAGLLAHALAANPLGGELSVGGELGQVVGRLGPADLVLIGLIATGVKAIAGVLLTFVEARVGAQVADRTRDATILALLQRGQRFAGRKTLATLSSRCREIEQATVFGIVRGARAAAQLVPLVAALILMSPRLALVGTLALAPFAILLSRLRGYWRRTMARAQDLRDELTMGVDDLVANLDLWRVYSAGESARRAVGDAAHQASAASAKAGASRAALSGFNEVLAVLALMGCISFAPALGVDQVDGTLLAFAAVFFMAYRPLRDLGDARAWLLKGSVSLEAVSRLANEAGEPKQPTPAAAAHPLAPAVLELRGFGHRRLGRRTTWSAQPGQIVALVGPTGAGKTSLLRAMLGLEPSLGELLFGGQSLANAGIGPPERPFAWIPQDAPIVSGSLLQNVALFADEARAREALQLIGAETLLEQMEVEPLGPGGRPVSGGERRLISLARALASGLPVLLLDEPTEGLDREAQARVLAALNKLRRERTLVIVTHRAEVEAIADQVVSLTQASAEDPTATDNRVASLC